MYKLNNYFFLLGSGTTNFPSLRVLLGVNDESFILKL